MTIAVDGSHHFEYAGVVHRFCGARCVARFREDPAHYVGEHRRGQPPKRGTTPLLRTPVQCSVRRYTCPMHPQIVRDAPGTCPICGMALEPMLPSLRRGERRAA